MEADPLEIAREAVALDRAANDSRKSAYAAHVAACDEFLLHATKHYGATAQTLLAKHAEVSALEGLLRECGTKLSHEPTCQVVTEYLAGEHYGVACTCILSRLDAALTPDRKEQDGTV